MSRKIQWKGRLLVLWSGLGEYAWAKRLENACKNLGWECRSLIDPAELSEYDKLVQDRQTTPEEISVLARDYDPDCIISLKWDRIYAAEVPSYLALTGVFQINRLNPHSDRYGKTLLDFRGFLTAVNNNAVRDYCEFNHKTFYEMPWYPSCTRTEYNPVIPKRIFCCGFQWDSKRNGPEYRKMFSLLDQHDVLTIYGPAYKWDCAPHSVKGMTFDEEEFRKAMRECGIVLAIHTQRNLNVGAPSARVFEAAAACCVIICDRHPFIINEFGDCILYIDENLSGEELFQQIESHRQWIMDHPKEAEAMAKKAHSIFTEKFALENQLEIFKEFHLGILES